MKSHTPVIQSAILCKESFCSSSGRTLQLLHIEYPDFEFQPGQFVMIRKENGDFHWSYPYMIFKQTDRGFQVLAAQTDSLFHSDPGETVAVWGANGTGLHLAEHSWFLAEPQTIHLIAPLMAACPDPSLLLIGTDTQIPPLPLSYSIHCCETLHCGIKHILEKSHTSPFLYAALNPNHLLLLKQFLPETQQQNTMIFASTVIGCGTGACKSCYLHSPDLHTGIPVCCKGPYLPCSTVDVQTDAKCFQTFQ